MSTPIEPDRTTEAFLDDPVEVEPETGALLTTQGRNTERLVFFSDAVIAIALTLLVLDIRLPEEVTDEGLGDALREILPQFWAFVISFGVIAGAWLTHFRRFRLMTGYDRTTTLLNFLLLFLICLTPFPTSVFAHHAPTPWATVLYGATLGSIFLVQVLSWRHAYRAGLLAPVVDEANYRRVRTSLGILAAVFLLSLPLAFIEPWLTWVAWSILTPLSTIVVRLGARRTKG